MGRETRTVPLMEKHRLKFWAAEEDIWAEGGRDNRWMERTAQWRTLWPLLLTKYHSVNQIKNQILV